jgi:gluconolactonase
MLYVAVTRANRLVTIPLRPNYGGINKAAVFVQLSGGLTGPDGVALDAEGGLAVVHGGFGTVWILNRFGEPMYRVRSTAGIRTTNVAYGGPEGRTLFITEAERGAILKAELPVPGATVFGLS